MGQIHCGICECGLLSMTIFWFIEPWALCMTRVPAISNGIFFWVKHVNQVNYIWRDFLDYSTSKEHGSGNHGSSTYNYTCNIYFLNKSSQNIISDILQITFSDAISWLKMLMICFNFHWMLFLGSNWYWNNIVWVNGLVPNRQWVITWSNDDPLHRM